MTPTDNNTPNNNDKQQDKKKPMSIFRQVPKWQDLWFYQKSEVLYQLTYAFCERFLPQYGDRTVDQMVQAARSCKQNIVEGSEDGKTSTQMELQLLNVARSSIGELRQDFEDYLKSRRLHQWTHDDERFQPMQDFTKTHNHLSDYEPFFQQWSAEEMANVGLTLCFQVDTMMNKYMEGLEKTFVTQGGIKERMHAARTGYRQQQDKRLAELEKMVPILQQQLELAQTEAAKWKTIYEDLKQRALSAYQKQQAGNRKTKKDGWGEIYLKGSPQLFHTRFDVFREKVKRQIETKIAYGSNLFTQQFGHFN